MRAVAAAALVVALAAPAALSAPGAAPLVGCDEVIGRVGSGHVGGYRVVLGVFSVPRSYMPEIEDTEQRPWRYWRKAGLVVRAGAGTPVSVSVAPAWRDRVAIGWGGADTVSSLRLTRCAADQGANRSWVAYAGGFVLRVPSECVPLVFRAGGRTATIRFGLGKRC
jgi:hypothetical protein